VGAPGRNHYPDDIEATVQAISGGRVAVIAIPDDETETLVVVIELKKREDSGESFVETCESIRREVTSAISKSHGMGVANLVLVPLGSIPITTSGKDQTHGMYGKVPKQRIHAS
jgi:acyl-CoA synthetase (AMP-forming)/AMP-acid ligase II